MSSEEEEEEGMGTSGEIRREELEAALSSALELRAEHQRLLAELQATTADLEERRRSAASAPERGTNETPSTGTVAYGDFVKDELEAQDKRKTSFEQRGLAVITTSGTLVTLLFALVALSTKKADTFVLPHAAHTWLTVSLVFFFLSALAALLANAPFIYQAVEAAKIRERLHEKPPRALDAAIKDVAYTRLDALESAKAKNSIKGRALAVAMSFEALAVGCVAVAVAIIL
jgi:hypothetical protein